MVVGIALGLEELCGDGACDLLEAGEALAVEEDAVAEPVIGK